MKEEQVTEAIENHLKKAGWTMFAVDYPTSGSGLRLHPNDREAGTKHGGSIVPDVVAYRKSTVLVVESKPYFDTKDAAKLLRISDGRYSESLHRRVYATEIKTIQTALAFPKTDADSIKQNILGGVDKLLLVDEELNVTVDPLDPESG